MRDGSILYCVKIRGGIHGEVHLHRLYYLLLMPGQIDACESADSQASITQMHTQTHTHTLGGVRVLHVCAWVCIWRVCVNVRELVRLCERRILRGYSKHSSRFLKRDFKMLHYTPEIRLLKTCKTANQSRVSCRAKKCLSLDATQCRRPTSFE